MPKLTPPLDSSLPMVRHALWWAECGWRVFPVCWPAMPPHEHSKQPCTKDLGKGPLIKWSDASTDADTIREWWSRWPDANIGGRPPEGQFVVDIDGPVSVEFPPTWENTTAKGRHLVYQQCDPPVEQTNPSNAYWPNVDTRTSDKGYVVLPPSKHVRGVRYAVRYGVEPVVFPADMVPERATKPAVRRKTAVSPVVRLLTLPRDSEELGDDAMAKVAGWVARVVPDVEHFDALLGAINQGLAAPLDGTALAKKRGIWEKHQQHLAELRSASVDDEARGWLFAREPTGYDTPIENRDGTVEYMAVTDFSLKATGVIVSSNYSRRVFIVDCYLADGTVITGQKIDTDTMCDTARFKKWLARRGMNVYDHRKDPRGGVLGQRLIKLLESQQPTALQSRDYYGWCDETQAFITELGEVTINGLQPFTKVHPEDKLRTDAPSMFRFDADLASARDWLQRVLALQPEVESAKIGAWAMMLLLRGQWQGLLPGLLVQASAGTGKTRYFQLLFKLLGSTNEGESLTLPAMRDKLLGNTSNAVWLDDVALGDREQQLMRGAITSGKVTHKQQGLDGWETVEKTMRASIVVSGEGVDWYRQKALRDRFIEVQFTTDIRTVDADKLLVEDIGRGSGALLVSILSNASRLGELEALREGVTQRDDHARTTLRIGARILDAVLGTGHKWTRILDGWYLGSAQEESKGQSGENVLNVIPTLWTRLGEPKGPGVGALKFPVWYDEVEKTFWINAKNVADQWNQTQRGLNDRLRQLTNPASITRELDACGASESTNKPTKMDANHKRSSAKYRQLPANYTRMALDTLDYEEFEDE